MHPSLRRMSVGLTAATLAAVGVAVPTAPAHAAVASPVINEFSASTTGTDVEFVELLAPANADLTSYKVLSLEGDGATTPAYGTVDAAITLGNANADGRYLANLSANVLENGTMSLLLVTGFTGVVGTDLDSNDDGVLNDGTGITVVDAVAVNDGSSAGDITYGGTTLATGYDGFAFTPGGASRIPDGTDTGGTADWVRNDFDLAGITGFTGTIVPGEAYNTPGAVNEYLPVPPPPPTADCAAPAVAINSVQGPGAVSPRAGETVEISGVVVGDVQEGGFDGYYLQEVASVDADPMTSEGIFVYAVGGAAVSVGDEIHVVGSVSEYNGLTEITASSVDICASGSALPAPAVFAIPNESQSYESLEGMLVTLPQSLTILEYFNFGRYGEIALGTERQLQPTAVVDPGTAATQLAQQNALKRIVLDDGRNTQNPDPAIHPNGLPFTLQNTFRGGDRLTDVTGVLDYRFDLWRIQPTKGAQYQPVNARPAVPEVGGNMTVASFNVLNYFTSIGTGDAFRGANTQAEFDRQEAKIVSAITAIDADVFGLIEIENNGTAVQVLVDAINEAIGADTYEALVTGPIGTDAITTALIYKPSEVGLVGAHAVLDATVDPEFDTTKNRPALAQTFADLGSGEQVTVVVNHLKSKGSDCNDIGDPDTGDGQGNCNLTRTKAAVALAEWLATAPTGAEPGRELIIGDLNSYDKEDPIEALTSRGYTDLLFRDQGEEAYSYVFDGQLGYLDYALAGTSLAAQVTGAAAWAINADEPSLIDYDMTFKLPAQDELYAPDPYRSSDHDPVVIGIELPTPDTTAPELTVTADPAAIAKANGRYVTVNLDVQASDDSGGVVEVELVATQASGRKASLLVDSDTQVRVKAVKGAVYTLTYKATDPSGNATTEEVTIRVAG